MGEGACLALTVEDRGDAASGGAPSQPGMLPKTTYRMYFSLRLKKLPEIFGVITAIYLTVNIHVYKLTYTSIAVWIRIFFYQKSSLIY